MKLFETFGSVCVTSLAALWADGSMGNSNMRFWYCRFKREPASRLVGKTNYKLRPAWIKP